MIGTNRYGDILKTEDKFIAIVSDTKGLRQYADIYAKYPHLAATLYEAPFGSIKSAVCDDKVILNLIVANRLGQIDFPEFRKVLKRLDTHVSSQRVSFPTYYNLAGYADQLYWSVIEDESVSFRPNFWILNDEIKWK